MSTAGVFHEKSRVVRPLKKFPALHGTLRFIRRAYKSPPIVPILSQMNPVNIFSSYFSKIHFNIILSPTSRSS
jgi:hypothetical protein